VSHLNETPGNSLGIPDKGRPSSPHFPFNNSLQVGQPFHFQYLVAILLGYLRYCFSPLEVHVSHAWRYGPMDRETRRLDVLRDAENAQLSILLELLADIVKNGPATRVYGDFTNSALATWRDPMPRNNARDNALFTDAIELPYFAAQLSHSTFSRHRPCCCSGPSEKDTQ
jgi:hypothetical protein